MCATRRPMFWIVTDHEIQCVINIRLIYFNSEYLSRFNKILLNISVIRLPKYWDPEMQDPKEKM